MRSALRRQAKGKAVVDNTENEEIGALQSDVSPPLWPLRVVGSAAPHIRGKQIAHIANAPPELVELYARKGVTYGINELQALISAKGMHAVWHQLEKRAPAGHALALFRKVRELADKKKAREPKPQDVAKHYKDIARYAETLCRLIRDSETDPGVMFDLEVFEYASAETMGAYGIQDWGGMHAQERQLAGWAVLPYWPHTGEILKGLAEKAKAAAALKAEDRRAVKKIMSVDQQRERYFVVRLAEYVQETYGAPLYGTIARIANAVLGTGLTPAAVKDMARGSKRASKIRGP